MTEEIHHFTKQTDTMKNTITRLGCGLDISKDKFDVCFGVMLSDASFVIKGSRSFANKKAGINEFLVWLGKNHAKHNPTGELPFQVVMETTGVYHEHVCLSLYEASWPVCVEVSSRVKRYLQSIGQYSKTDKLDAKGICRLACERKVTLWRPFSPKTMAIRTAIRHRKSLIDNKNRLGNQLHALSHSANKDSNMAASIKRLVKAMDKEIAKIEEHIHELYEADPVLKERLDAIVKSVKGLGLVTALTVVAETNGFDLFQNAKQLVSYAGLDIIENASGNSTRPTKISKRGNARIRNALYMCALTMGKYKDAPFAGFFSRIRAKNPKIYKIANVAVQRKLLVLIYTLFKNNTSFDPAYNKQNIQISSSELNSELREIAAA